MQPKTTDVYIAPVAYAEEIKKPEDVPGLISYYAKRYDYNETLALKIAECESGFDHTIKNASSTARGTFQFIDSTWYETMRRMGRATSTPKTDKEIGVEAGIWLLKKDGTRHWNESKPCWGKYENVPS